MTSDAQVHLSVAEERSVNRDHSECSIFPNRGSPLRVKSDRRGRYDLATAPPSIAGIRMTSAYSAKRGQGPSLRWCLGQLRHRGQECRSVGERRPPMTEPDVLLKKGQSFGGQHEVANHRCEVDVG